MLASLNDPYSRFVSPKQFAALAKYDVTGIGLNIGEDVEDGRVKLKVVGIVLGSPAQLAGELILTGELIATSQYTQPGFIGLRVGEDVEGGRVKLKVVGIVLGSPAQLAGELIATSQYTQPGFIGLRVGEDVEGGRVKLKVVGIVLGSPAQRAGELVFTCVQQGDRLVSVDGTSVQGMPAFSRNWRIPFPPLFNPRFSPPPPLPPTFPISSPRPHSHPGVRQCDELVSVDGMSVQGMSAFDVSSLIPSHPSLNLCSFRPCPPPHHPGVRQGDELVSVDGTSVQGMSAFDVSSLIQGPKGTPVTIAIRHDSCSPIESLTMSRTSEVQSPVLYRLDRNDPISPLGLFQDFSSAASSSSSPSPSASSSSSMFSSVFSSSSAPTGPVGYIRLKEFNAAAKRDVVTAIQRLEAAGATSFVLDLQDNPGGLVQSGVEIAKLFLERGQTVVYTEARPGDLPQKRSIEATGKPLTRAPLTVLVNGRTASASEIVAGALHDNCRAVLVGSRTFGKGLIQSVYELNDGSGMVVTVGKYVTPGLVDIDGNGIAADFRRKPSGDMARWKLANCKVPSSVGGMVVMVGKGRFIGGSGKEEGWWCWGSRGMVVTVGKYVTPGLVDIDGYSIAADIRRKPSGDMARWKLANCKVPS
ncbi:unnamed protein product [Closterium sp. NIES-65]|nr:unnamed protein product [Closterium sp. NIES-65]